MGFLSSLQHNHANIYSLIVSLLLAVWYNGISGAINYYLPERGPFILFLMLTIPLVVFLIDDGNLDELYTAPNIKYPILSGVMGNQPNPINQPNDQASQTKKY